MTELKRKKILKGKGDRYYCDRMLRGSHFRLVNRDKLSEKVTFE